MQDKIFKVKIFEVTRKSVKSVKVFSLEIFRLYGKYNRRNIASCSYISQSTQRFTHTHAYSYIPSYSYILILL